MRKLNLNTQLIGGFAMMGLIILMGGLLGYQGISRLGDHLEEMTTVHFRAIHTLGTVTDSQKIIQKATRSLLIPEALTVSAEKALLFAKVDGAWRSAEEGLNGYTRLRRTGEGERLWNEMAPAWENWRKKQNKVIQILKDGKRKEALALNMDQEKDAAVRVENLLKDLTALHMKLGAEANKKGSSMAVLQKNGVLIGTAMGMGWLLFSYGSSPDPLRCQSVVSSKISLKPATGFWPPQNRLPLPASS